MIYDISTRRLDGDKYKIVFRIKIEGIRGKKRRELFMEGLISNPAITEARICNHEEFDLEK